MLRSKKFRPLEMKLLWGIALLLVVAAVAGVLLAIHRADWRVFLASLGLGGIAALYLGAAKRGRPL